MQTTDQILSTLPERTKQILLTAINRGGLDLQDQKVTNNLSTEAEKKLDQDLVALQEAKELLASLLYKKPTVDNLARYWVNQPSRTQPHHSLHGVNLLAEMTPDSDGIVRAYMVEGDVISMNVQKGALSGGWVAKK